MGLFDHFPYTNVHELNLDWVLTMMKALEAEWEAYTAGNALTFADPLQHDISKTYAKNTIVIDGAGNAYLSLQPVPVGIALGNQDYWLMVFDYEAFIEKVNKNFTARYYRGSYRATSAMAIGDWLTVDDVLCKATAAIAADDALVIGVNIEHFTLEDFIKAFMTSANQMIQQYKNDIDYSELQYRNQLAQDIADTTASLQAQLDAAIAGATVDSEVINARVGWDNTTYPTLHDAIVGQIEQCLKSAYTVTAGNYSTLLPDCDNVPANTAYLLNFGAADSKPANLPVSGGISMASLITIGKSNSYYVQYYIDNNVTYKRLWNTITWGSWTLITNRTKLMTSNILITSGNYSSLLPDCDNATAGCVYLFNLGGNSARPANFPVPTAGVSMGLLFTTVDTYKAQYYIDDASIYKRTYGASWGSWYELINFTNAKRALITNMLITSGNYSTSLPDCDNAAGATLYMFNFAANGARPAHFPVPTAGVSMGIMLTVIDTYRVQIYIDDSAIYKRTYGASWGDWNELERFNRINATPSTLISLLKQYANKNVDLYLQAGTYDVYQMYLDEYGANFWNDYTGYVGEPDPFYTGLSVRGVNLIGDGNAKFVWSGTPTTYTRDHFSFFAPSGVCKLENLQIDIGTSNCEYAIHDDVAAANSIIEYKNLIIKGTPGQGSLIGAGFGLGCKYKIEDCVFLDNGGIYDISYHSNGSGTVPCFINISNCYGTKDCAFRWYGTGTAMNQCIVNNSKFNKIEKKAHIFTPNTTDNMNLITYLNETNS